MNNKGQVGLVELDTTTLPRWLLYPLVILICLALFSAIIFVGIVAYSCYKGNCNGYYGMGGFGYRYYPIGRPITLQMSSQECYQNGIAVNCSEMK